MKKLALVSFICVAFLFTTCDDPSEVPQPDLSIGTSATGLSLKAHVSNPRFEKPIDFTDLKKKSDWSKQAWLNSVGDVTWEKGFGVKNSGGIRIRVPSSHTNDICIKQTIKLDPGKLYRLNAWVKTDEITGGSGATVCIYGTWTHSTPVIGTHDWQEISVEFSPPSSGEVMVACRLGYWSATSNGTAYFDNITVTPLEKFINNGEHIRLVLDPEDAAAVRTETINKWVNNLDRAYEKYYELMGDYPYSGERITIMSVAEYPGGWAVAGNPILWYKPYIASTLIDIQNTGDWSFGILHELGHDFGLQYTYRRWIWHEEMFANFRMYYVVEKLNADIYLDRQIYTGTELETYFKTDNGESYDNQIAKGIPKGENGIMYTLIRIKNVIGWEPFIKTYKELNNTPAYGNDWDMFNLFLDKLTWYSGYDVRTTYLPGELETIRQIVIND